MRYIVLSVVTVWRVTIGSGLMQMRARLSGLYHSLWFVYYKSRIDSGLRRSGRLQTKYDAQILAGRSTLDRWRSCIAYEAETQALLMELEAEGERARREDDE